MEYKENTPVYYKAITLTLRPQFCDNYPDPRIQHKQCSADLQYLLEKYNVAGTFVTELTQAYNCHYHGYIIPGRKLDETKPQGDLHRFRIETKKWPFGRAKWTNESATGFKGWVKYMNKETGATRSELKTNVFIIPRRSKVEKSLMKVIDEGESDDESDSDEESRPAKGNPYGIQQNNCD